MLFLLHKLYTVDAELNTLSHTDTLSSRIKNCTHLLHAGTQTHPAKQDYPCQGFGRALIWSNGGSESWFVFPSVVRPRSSLPGDTTSCILTPSDTEIHPPSWIFNMCTQIQRLLCASAHVPIPYACNRATDNQIIYKSVHFITCSPFLCFCSTATAAFFFLIMWMRHAPTVQCNPNRQMRRERLVFFHLERALSQLLMSCQIIWCHRGQGLINGDEWNCQRMGTGVLYWDTAKGEETVELLEGDTGGLKACRQVCWPARREQISW